MKHREKEGMKITPTCLITGNKAPSYFIDKNGLSMKQLDEMAREKSRLGTSKNWIFV